eukprot:13072629-Alexandrium_andersonii.AAC.1
MVAYCDLWSVRSGESWCGVRPWLVRVLQRCVDRLQADSRWGFAWGVQARLRSIDTVALALWSLGGVRLVRE